MFEEIRECLDKIEKADHNYRNFPYETSKEDEDILVYSELYITKALMKDSFIDSERVAKLILAAKGLSNEIKVKVE